MIEWWMGKTNQITKPEFDMLCKTADFEDGPHVSTFGDGYGEPYNPNREAWGTLESGLQVWAWVQGPNAKAESLKLLGKKSQA